MRFLLAVLLLSTSAHAEDRVEVSTASGAKVEVAVVELKRALVDFLGKKGLRSDSIAFAATTIIVRNPKIQPSGDREAYPIRATDASQEDVCRTYGFGTSLRKKLVTRKGRLAIVDANGRLIEIFDSPDEVTVIGELFCEKP